MGESNSSLDHKLYSRIGLHPIHKLSGDLGLSPSGCDKNNPLREGCGEEAHANQSILTKISEVITDNRCSVYIKQYPVQDPDYTAEYINYYAKCFSNTDKYCTRLHFFTEPAQSGEGALDYLDRVDVEKTYLGFVTIRPLEPISFGASIIIPPREGYFIITKEYFEVHLAGKCLNVVGTPFMQQDNAVGTCAQASIWMALRTTMKKEGQSAYDPAQITNAATRFLANGRSMPNRDNGLGIEQIVEAVRSTGYSSHVLKLNPEKSMGVWISDRSILIDAKRKIYTYVESGIPVILGVYREERGEGHALVVIGHKWLPKEDCRRASKANFLTRVFSQKNGDNEVEAMFQIKSKSKGINVYHSSAFAGDFVVNNDNSGPYCDLPLNDNEGYSLKKASYGIPLLPSDVFVTGEEAEIVVKQILEQILAPLIEDSENPRDIVIRLYLCERHKLRKWATEDNSLCADLKRHYRLREFPRRIWLAEINLRQGYEEALGGCTNRVGEVIIDPTGDPNNFNRAVLSCHLNMSIILDKNDGGGLLFDNDYQGGGMVFYFVRNDSIYKPTKFTE